MVQVSASASCPCPSAGAGNRTPLQPFPAIVLSVLGDRESDLGSRLVAVASHDVSLVLSAHLADHVPQFATEEHNVSRVERPVDIYGDQVGYLVHDSRLSVF